MSEADLTHRVRLALSELDALLESVEKAKTTLAATENVGSLLAQIRRTKVAVKGIQETA